MGNHYFRILEDQAVRIWIIENFRAVQYIHFIIIKCITRALYIIMDI